MSIIISLYYLLCHFTFSVVGGNPPAFYYPVDNIAVNCGFSGNSSSALDGRQWIGDIGSKYIISRGSKAKLISSTPVDRLFSVNPVPYGSARISRSQFTYRFHVSAGPKFIRLHFFPASYPGFKRSKAFFTVKAGPYTLLSNFSASLTADALVLQSFAKEFCVNVEENQPLIVTFSPSTDGTLDEVYAFVNGIEIVSLPTGLYHTLEGDPGARVAGKKYRFPIDESIALELVQRLNVGGSSILSVEDTGMFREWSEDSNHLLESSRLPVSTTIRIKYTNTPTYSAPQKVYQTCWSMVLDQQANKTFNFTWKLPVDLGFRYLLRFHFCELEYEIKGSGHMVFKIFVNNQMVEANADIIKWSGSNGVAVYRDYVLTMEGDRMEGKCDMVIALCPHNHGYEWRTTHIDAILKGLEVFKLSNPDNNLAGVNPVPVASGSIFGNPNPRKFVFASGGNVIATGVVIFLCVLNIIIYQDIQADNALPQGTVPSCALVAQDQCRDIQADDAGTVPSLSTPVQYCENIPQAKKSSMGKLNNVFQSIIALLGKGMNVRWRKTKVYDSNSGMLQWDSSTPRLHGFSFREIKEATNDFYYELEIGDGGFNKVYKGWINHKTVEQIWHNDIEVGSPSHDDPVKERFCHAYNNVLSYDGAFDISDPDTGTNGLLIKKI
ncbi:Receptor-like protein kinase FERONIA [Camellia lanceoleosa]|uniref:Receptor-like protein kinase FERONIA n=1 Tax=Camellia lanceoleosa TaxID=1840588 RepID=A0ACC0IWP2_9ERIC|nr:Receptor-like protein kinase FERONIA [Camellia lanceoleosa]